LAALFFVLTPISPGKVGNPWPFMRAKLDVLHAFVVQNNLSMAVIPDATGDTFKAAGGAVNRVLNDQFLQVGKAPRWPRSWANLRILWP
jgi:hypothetical protein